jgi:GAF domain-containing protein/HAMP domain-containing protein
MSPPSVHWRQPTVGQSIRTRLLVLLVGLATISVMTVGYLGVNSMQRVGERAQQVSAEALRAQAEEYLRQVTVADTEMNNLALEEVQQDAWNIAQVSAGIFERPDAFAGSTYWRAEEHMFTGPDGQYMNGESDVSDAFVPNFVDIDDELLAILDLSAYLDFSLVPTYESSSTTVAIYLGTEEEILRYYPNINIGAVVPPDFQVTQRPWYVSAAPENNPERGVVWSPVYVDATGRGLMVTAAAPVYTSQDEFVGVIGIDVTLEEIDASVKAARLLGSGYSFLIDDTGHAIVLPEQGYRDILGRPPEPEELRTDLSEVTTGFAPILADMASGSTGFDALESGGRELFVAYAPLESTGWSLANVVEAEDVLQAMVALQRELGTSTQSLVLTRILPVGGGILVVIAIVGLLLTHRLVEPIRKMAAAAQRIGAGQWDVPLPRAGNDEIGVLSQAFATMTVQLRELMEDLERRVAERTLALQETNYALQRRAIHLETSAEVGRAITSILDVDQLLRRTTELIRDRFGFYHAGIFLLDETGEWAVLREATGEAGAQMKAEGHRLAVGDTSMVGWAALNRRPRVALDVGDDAVHFANPLLPYTRSEMVLPLMVGDRFLGVLDVQSTEASAFDEEDIRVLQSMANQVAVAIENARKVSDEALLLEATSPIYRASRRLAQATTIDEVADSIIASAIETGADGCTVVEFEFSPAGEPETLMYRGVWRRDREPQFEPGMRIAITESPFPLHTVSTLWTVADVERDEHLPQSARQVFEATGARALVNIPLRARERVIGQVVVLRATPGPFSDAALRLYEALSNQAAVALERAQLLEEAQRRAEREQLARQMIDHVRRAVDIEQALQTTAEELSRAMSVPHVSIELSLEAPRDESHNGPADGSRRR